MENYSFLDNQKRNPLIGCEIIQKGKIMKEKEGNCKKKYHLSKISVTKYFSQTWSDIIRSLAEVNEETTSLVVKVGIKKKHG